MESRFLGAYLGSQAKVLQLTESDSICNILIGLYVIVMVVAGVKCEFQCDGCEKEIGRRAVK